MRAYNARLRAIPAVLDTAIAQTKLSDAAGIHAPRFEIERVISGQQALTSGAPFDGGKDSPLWADAKAKVAKLQASGKVSAAEADALLADSRTAILGLKPAYGRIIAWASSELPTAPSGRVGAISLPGGADWYAAALQLATTTDLTAAQIHQIGLNEVKRIEGEQDALARQAGFADRNAFYADREKRFPPSLTPTPASRLSSAANAAIAQNRAFFLSASTTSRNIAPRWSVSPRSAKSRAAPRTLRAQARTARAQAASMSTCSATPTIRRRSTI